MTVRRALLVAVALAVAPFAARADDAAGRAEAGRKLYVGACQRCHGISLASNGIGMDLRTFRQQDKERFVRSVTNGVRAMPAWGSTLKPEQIDLIWAYVGEVNGWQESRP